MRKIIERRPNGTKRVATAPSEEPSLTQQQFAKDCDVNLIIAKYKKTGSVTHIRNGSQGVYADLADMPSYQEALQHIINAQQAFGDLPAQTRARFANDPQQLIDFLKDPQNVEESIKLGLRVKPEVKKDPVLETLQSIDTNLKSQNPKS